jgi:hypothetical protein
MTHKRTRIIAGLVLVVFSGFAVFFINGGPLLYQGHANKQYLAGLDLLPNAKNYGISAHPDAAAPYGTAAPAGERFAVSGTFATVYGQLSSEMRQKGYTFSNKYVVAGPTSNTIDSVGTYATSGKHTLYVSFGFNNPYQCSSNTSSSLTTICNSDIRSYPSLLSYRLNTVDVSYDGYSKAQPVPVNF